MAKYPYTIPPEGFDEVEQRALFEFNSLLSRDEAFEVLDSNSVAEIPWDRELNASYSLWGYFNNK